MNNGKSVIEALVATFNRKDVEAVMAFFTPDAVYHNMPMAPVSGLEAIRGVIEMFTSPAEIIDWQIVEMAENGPVVFAERLDRFVMNGKTVDLPCAGVFHLDEGKIRLWRDYFDMQTWQRQTQGDEQ